MPSQLSFRIPASLAAIDAVRRRTSERLRDEDIDEEVVFDLELALTEALSNTIRHGYAEDGRAMIELALTVEPEHVEFVIHDRGTPFDPAEVPPTNLDEPGEGGYGLSLLGELLDELTRSPGAEGETIVRLVKYRKQHTQTSPPTADQAGGIRPSQRGRRHG